MLCKKIRERGRPARMLHHPGRVDVSSTMSEYRINLTTSHLQKTPRRIYFLTTDYTDFRLISSQPQKGTEDAKNIRYYCQHRPPLTPNGVTSLSPAVEDSKNRRLGDSPLRQHHDAEGVASASRTGDRKCRTLRQKVHQANHQKTQLIISRFCDTSGVVFSKKPKAPKSSPLDIGLRAVIPSGSWEMLFHAKTTTSYPYFANLFTLTPPHSFFSFSLITFPLESRI